MSKTRLSAWDSLTEWCLPWWKALFILLSWTTLTSCREGICRRSQLRLMDYVKYAEDVWETGIFCLTWTILEIKPIQADRQSDDLADTQELTTVMKQGVTSGLISALCVCPSRRDCKFYRFDILETGTIFTFRATFTHLNTCSSSLYKRAALQPQLLQAVCFELNANISMLTCWSWMHDENWIQHWRQGSIHSYESCFLGIKLPRSSTCATALCGLQSTRTRDVTWQRLRPLLTGMGIK